MSLKHPLITLLVGLVVVSAGCVGASTSSPQTTTEVTTQSTTTTTHSPTTYAPGVSSEGVNALKLARTHQEVLAGQPFIKTKTINRPNSPTKEIERFHYENKSSWLWTVHGDAPGALFVEPNGTAARFADGTKVHQYRKTASGEVQIGTVMSMHGGLATPQEAFNPVVFERGLLYNLLSSENITTARGEDSAALITGSTKSATIGNDQVSDVEFFATVSESGFVSTLYIQYEYAGSSYQQTIHFTTKDVGPVQSPKWVNKTAS